MMNININILDKIIQLQDLVGVIDLEYFRNFYFSHEEAHIFNLNLYDVVGIRYDRDSYSRIFSLYIGCSYIFDDEGLYHIFLNFDNLDVVSHKYDYILAGTTENIKAMLNSHEMIVDRGFYMNLNAIAHKILKLINENNITDYEHYLNYIRELSERIENDNHKTISN